MDETRRNLMKGMLTGGTLLALGIPSITQAVSINQSLSDKTQNCRLLLGNTQIGEMFFQGCLCCLCHLYQLPPSHIANSEIRRWTTA
jgi:hypothetical protein